MGQRFRRPFGQSVKSVLVNGRREAHAYLGKVIDMYDKDLTNKWHVEIEFFEGMITAFEKAESQGVAAVVYEGMHIDYAHVKTAREVLAYAKNFDQS